MAMADLPGADERPHDEAEALLPWYATGQLDERDRAIVEDHLQSCVQCQQQLFVERRIVDEFGTLVPQVENGWAKLRASLDAPALSKRPPLFQPLVEMWHSLTRPAAMGFVAAQAVFLLIAGSLFISLQRPPAAQYHALSSGSVPTQANMIVMFQGNTTEQQMRDALNASGASLVGGPTEADAYLLHVQANERAHAIASLQSDRHVTLAQPIDGTAG
jgi:anti-sigma factor RsiW